MQNLSIKSESYSFVRLAFVVNALSAVGILAIPALAQIPMPSASVLLAAFAFLFVSGAMISAFVSLRYFDISTEENRVGTERVEALKHSDTYMAAGALLYVLSTATLFFAILNLSTSS